MVSIESGLDRNEPVLQYALIMLIFNIFLLLFYCIRCILNLKYKAWKKIAYNFASSSVSFSRITVSLLPCSGLSIFHAAQ